jgi:lipid-binding SYLF domain-containing protein
MTGALRRTATACAIAIAVTSSPPAWAASRAALDREASAALRQLYAQQPSARRLGARARAILVFPSIVKAGFMFGGAIGDGVLKQGGKTTGFYNSVAASYGFQAGIQKYAYALFFMTDAAIEQLNTTAGFEVGVGPSVVVVDQGIARSLTTETIRSDVYAFIFSQKGLMAGAGIQGSKITPLPS